MAENMMMNDAPQQSTGKSWKTYAILAGVALILALGISFMMSPSSEEPQGILPGDQNSLVLNNQNADSLSILVSQVSCIAPCFIAIQEDAAGAPGKLVATSKLYAPGLYSNESITANLSAGKRYWGILYGDNGNGIFDMATDALLTDPAGTPIRTPFMVNQKGSQGDKG